MKEKAYKRYLLGVLMTILAFNQIDGMALALAMQDIKTELGLADTQLGLLTGIAFALFYSVMGIPIARWADRGNRVAIISITTVLWCGAMALCGMAASFVQWLLIRIGVAVGEAGSVAPAHSLIADHFDRAERPRAVALYMLGGPLSVVLGYFLAGWLNELYGWRTMFMMLGLPGMAVALVTWLTLREPRRMKRAKGHSAASCFVTQESGDAQPRLMHVCMSLWSSCTFRHLLIGYSIASFFGYGIGKWLPSFFMRSYGLTSGELGTWFALMLGMSGLLGTYWGGVLACRYAPDDEPLQLKCAAVVYCSMGALMACAYLSPTHYLSFGFMGIGILGGALVSGPLFATIQSLVSQRVRATAVAIIYLSANLIGMGLGPLAAGALSDALRPVVQEESLRYSLLILCPGYLWSAWHFWRASRTVTRDMQAARLDRDDVAAAMEVSVRTA